MVGRTKSRILDTVFHGSLQEFFDAASGDYDFTQLDDFGDTLNQNIHDWFSDPESLLAFQEYLCEKLDGCRYGTAESMTVWRIKDQEELDLNPGEEFYIIELKNSSQLFSQAYSSYTEVIQEIQKTFGELLPPNFPLDDFLVEIMGEVWG